MQQAKNNHQQQSLKQAFLQLSAGKKRLMKAKFTHLFGSSRSFYKKINGGTMYRAEHQFLLSLLLELNTNGAIAQSDATNQD